MTDSECQECEAIARELREAYRAIAEEIRAKAESGLEGFRDAVRFGSNLRHNLKTEQDVDYAMEALPQLQLKNSEKAGQAMSRKYVHEARSGHKVPPILDA